MEIKEAIEEAKKQIEEAHNLNDINIFMTDSTTLKILLNYIDKLQKENAELKEENTILEGNKIGYKLAIQELKEENQKINKAADKENVTMRWIDILNRIAGNQKVPHKIRYKLMIPKYQVMVYDSEEQEYRFENDMNEFVEISNHHLNDEVEIIEEGD